jgi:hypothetical protein
MPAIHRWGALQAQQVLNHVLTSLPHIQYASMPLTSFQNVDGRTSRPVVSTLGGDAGEFLLALSAFEQSQGHVSDWNVWDFGFSL